jgi:hypothetical protein
MMPDPRARAQPGPVTDVGCYTGAMLSRSLRLTAMCAGLLSGCGTPRLSPEQYAALEQRAAAVAHVRCVDAGFARAGRALVDGFPAAIEDDSFRAGDRLLYGIESFDGDAVERFYLTFATESAGDGQLHPVELVRHGDTRATDVRMVVRSPQASVRATLYDADRRELATAVSAVDCAIHELGLFAYARASLARSQQRSLASADSPRAYRRPLLLRDPDWGRAMNLHLLRELLANAALADLAGRLSIMPGWFEALGFLGEHLRVYFGLNRPRVVDAPIAGLAAGAQAIECCTSIWRKHPFVLVNVVMVPPIGPLAMTSGIVTLTGYRSEQPDRRFVVRLLGLDQPGARDSTAP